MQAYCNSMKVAGAGDKENLLDMPNPQFEYPAEQEYSYGRYSRSKVTGIADVHFRLSYGWKMLVNGFWVGNSHEEKWDVTIELKPCVGDDYPAVLRQMRRNGSVYLMIGQWTGAGVTFDMFKKFMSNEGITVVMEADVDNLVLPDFERIYTPPS